LEAGIRETTPQAVIFGEGADRLPNTTLFAVPGVKAETAIISFDLSGIAVSSGSACSSGKVQASNVLTAMGVEPALARGAVRVSLGWSTTLADVKRFQETWIMLAESLVKGRRGVAA
jgi:cysteine desulfurase